MRRRCLFLVFAIGLAAGWAAAQETSRPVAAEPKLRLELRTETPNVKLGESPRFIVEIVNEGTAPAVVVMPGDGSISGWRTPIVKWNPATASKPDCGNINALEAAEVRTLQPGERMALSEWVGAPAIKGIGRQKVTLEIEHVPDLVWKGIPLGKHDPEAMTRIRASAPYKLKSNVVEIDVRDPNPELSGATVSADALAKQQAGDLLVLDGLAKAGSNLSKPHLIEHHFICKTRTAVDRVTAWGADKSYGVSKISETRENGKVSLGFDLVKSMVPTVDAIAAETTIMHRAAAKFGAEYDGWGALVVK